MSDLTTSEIDSQETNLLNLKFYWRTIAILHLFLLLIFLFLNIHLLPSEYRVFLVFVFSLIIILFSIALWENSIRFHYLKYILFPVISFIFFLVNQPILFIFYSFFSLLNFLLLDKLKFSIISFILFELIYFFVYYTRKLDFSFLITSNIFFILLYIMVIYLKLIFEGYKKNIQKNEKTLELLKEEYNKYLLEYKILSSNSEQNMLFYQNVSDDVSKNAEKIYKNTNAIKERIISQNQSIQNLNKAIRELTEGIQNTTEEITKIVSLSEQSTLIAEKGRTEIQKTIKALVSLSLMVEKTSRSTERLIQSTNKINKILRTIEEIADKTNLLSLNAAIEAARSGEAGKGFAVVADEVSKLSEKTRQAVKEISNTISELRLQSDEALKIISSGHHLASEGVLISESAEKELQKIIDHFKNVTDRLQKISAISEEQTQNLENFASNLIQITKNIEGNTKSVEEILKALEYLKKDSESLRKTASEYEFTEETKVKIEHLQQIIQDFARDCSKILEDGVRKGIITEEELFDRNYIPIPNTNPQKFHTKFDSFCDKYIQDVEEEYLNKNPAFVFAVLNDNRGYIPTHNLKYSKPLTGNYEIDLVGNRTKRIFDDTTGLKAATNTTKPFLLQSYRRDTGEIIHDISSPVYVFGKHWGSVRIGFQLDKL